MVTMICHEGYIPQDIDIIQADTHGNWWCRNKEGSKYYILGSSNNIWLAIHEETETSIIVSFTFRYDRKRLKEDSITLVLSAFLDYVELLDK